MSDRDAISVFPCVQKHRLCEVKANESSVTHLIRKNAYGQTPVKNTTKPLPPRIRLAPWSV